MQEIEIERKTLLTKEEFARLEKALPFPEKAVVQVNHYFETENFALKEKGAALRIRTRNGKYFLTLKEPHTLGLLETHDILTETECNAWLQGIHFPGNNVLIRLKKLAIDVHHLRYFGALTTERKTFSDGPITYMLDKSHYLGVTDYELEIEAQTNEQANEALHRIITTYGIAEKVAAPKVKRFFLALKEQKQSKNI